MGTEFQANAARSKTHDRDYYEQQMSEMEERIEQLLEECEAVNQQEEGEGPWVAMNKGLADESRFKGKIEELLKIFSQTDREKVNRTDPDCAVMHSVQGSHASYNVQSVVDDQHGLIVHAEAVSETSDVNQFAGRASRRMRRYPSRVRSLARMRGMPIRRSWRRLRRKGSK